MRRSLTFTLFLLALTLGAQGQNVKFYANLDRTQIQLDEQVALTVSLEGEVQAVPRPVLPQLNQFIIYEAGRSQNFSYVNGQVSSSINFNYVLMPKLAGKFTIPPIEIQLEGKTYRTNPLEITVASSRSRKEPLQKGKAESQRGQIPDLWIETSLDRDTAYVGQQVTLTLKFYQGVRLFQNPEYAPPSLTGFWTEDLPPQKKYYQTIGNRRYYIQEIKTALFPATSGRKTIGAAELKCRVEDLESFFGRDPFSLFDQDLTQLFSQGKPKILRSKPLSLEVLSLPPGQPENFSGAVGKFSLKTELDKSEVEAGQPLTLRITISGVGNIKSVTAPVIPELAGFRTYNSGNSENISKADYKLQGTKTFEQILIPKEPGSFIVSPLEFSYFDVSEKKYKTWRSPSYTITVRSGGPSSMVSLPLAENQITNKIKDIHYLKTQLGHSKKGSYLYQSRWFLVMQSVPILALVLLWRRQALQDRLLGDRAYARLKLAYKNACKQLALARHNLTSGKQSEYYALLQKGLAGYLADKLNLDSTAVFTAEVVAQLQGRSLPESQIQLATSILQECEQARFGGASRDKNYRLRLLEEAETLLKNLEKHKWDGQVKTKA